MDHKNLFKNTLDYLNQIKSKDLDNVKDFGEKQKISSAAPEDLTPGPYGDLVNKNKREKKLKPGKPIMKPGKQFDNMDPSSYPSKQKETLNMWDLMKKSARTPQDKRDLRATIYASWKNPQTRKWLSEDELQLIGRGKKTVISTPISIPQINSALLKPIKFTPKPVERPTVLTKRNTGGITADLFSLQSEINKNLRYVLGDKYQDQKAESEFNNNNEEDSHD